MEKRMNWWHSRRIPRYSKNYLQLFGIVLFCIGIGFGITMGGYKLWESVFALSETTKVLPADTAFNAVGYADGAGAMDVLATEVKIATSSAWWNGDWDYKKQLTLKNLSGNTATAGATMKVTVDTKELFDANKLLASGDDLRVVYSTASAIFKELRRSTTPADGTTVQTSTATEIAFPLQADIAAGATDTNYYLYYGNPDAPSYPASSAQSAYDKGDAQATFVAPLRGSTTAVGGQTPTTATGAIRYSGSKSAMSFDGSNDQVYNSYNGESVTTFTEEEWVKVNKYPSGSNSMQLMSLRLPSFQLLRVEINSSGTLRVRDTNSQVSFNAGTLSLNTWTHVAITYNAGTIILYKNGVNEGSSSSFATSYTLSGVVFSESGGGQEGFSGSIDEYRLSTNIRYTANFNAAISPFISDSSTRLLYHFDENGDDPRLSGKVFDASGNGNHGTITGAKYVSGLVGVDAGTADTGTIGSQSYGSHEGVFIEEGTTNLVTNPSFENSTYNTNWGTNYMNYATASATFTPKVAKRNSAGPFAAGVMVQGENNVVNQDVVQGSTGSNINAEGSFKQNFDQNQGSISFWITPEWNGNDGKMHILYNANTYYVNGIYKNTSGSLCFDQGWGYNICTDISQWTSGSTYHVVFRWSRHAPLNGVNYYSVSINDVHSFSITTRGGVPGVNNYFEIGNDDRNPEVNYKYAADAIIEGLTIYRRPLFDGQYGIDVGNGDEIAQIYNSGTGKDPTLVTGSWDVVFALPTNGSTDELTTGTGNAWSHPHSSNLLYTSTTNTGGFMMNGTYTSDGWADEGTPTSVSALAAGEKIFSGGYKVTSDSAGEGIYRDITTTGGSDFVLRGLSHSDATCIPRITLYDQTGGAEIGHIDGSAASVRTVPSTHLFTGEMPGSGTKILRVKLTNTASSGTCYWHQVEVLANKITNPSMESGSGNPWLPTGWNNNGLLVNEANQDLSVLHSGSSSVRKNSTSGNSFYQYPTGSAGAYYCQGIWIKKNTGSPGAAIHHSLTAFQTNSSGGGTLLPSSISWTHLTGVVRGIDGTSGWNIAPGGVSDANFDDAYSISLQDVSITVTAASQANSTEATGQRVDGADTLTQPISGLSATSGVIKFKFTPRHDFNKSTSFGNSNPRIITLYGNSANSIYLYVPSTAALGLVYWSNNTAREYQWSAPTLNANTTYNMEISYSLGSLITLKVNGSVVASGSFNDGAFTVVPSTAYFGTMNNGTNQYDATFSSFVALTPSANTTAPYYKFGAASAKLTGTMDYADQYTTPVTLPSNGAYTVSAYVYNGTSGAVGGTLDSSVAQLASGSAALSTTYTDMGGGWWRLSNSSGNMPTQTINYGVELKAGKTVYIDGVQAEKKTYQTTYTDGSLGTGYAWTGTSNASTSTRSSTEIYHPISILNPQQGAWSVWVKPHNWTWNTLGSKCTSGTCFGVMGTGWGRADIGFTNGLVYAQKWVTSANGVRQIAYVPSGSGDGWRHLVFTYSSAGGAIYENGVLKNSSALDFSSIDFNNMGIVQRIGQTWNHPVGHLDGTLSELRIYNSALTGAQVMSLYYEGLSTHQNGNEGVDKYQASGTYTSTSIDLGANGAWGTTPVTFSHQLGGGSISYSTRTSADGTNWGGWAAVSGNAIASDPLRYLQFKADMTASADRSSTPVLTGTTISYVEDSTAPANPSAVARGYVNAASSSATLVSGNWYNHDTPKFDWDEGIDAPANGQSASGIASYLALLTTDSTATPSANLGDNCYKQTTSTDRTFTVGSSPSTCTLSDGTYYLRVQSKDNSGNTADPVTLFTYKYDGTRPNAPLSVSTTQLGYQANNEFTFFWPAATDNGPSGVMGYEYKTATSSGTFANWQFTASTSVAGIPAYSEGQNFFYVRTKDNSGNYSGETSNNVAGASFYYNRSAPTAPRNVAITPESTAASPAGANVFSVTWDKPENYSGEIAKYYYCVNCTPSALTMTETTAAETVNRTLTDIALATQQGKNTFYIVAEDNNVNTATGRGNVNFEAYASVDFYAATTAPGAPTNLTISDASDRTNAKWRLTLAWDEPSSGGTPTKYEIHRSADDTVYTKVGEVTSTAYTDTGLTQSQKYYYKVRAADNAGSTSIFSNTVSKAAEGKFKEPPTTGGTPNVTAGSTTATIKWSTSRKAIGTVEYGKSTSYGAAVSETVASADHSVKISGLAPGTQYHYRVQSVDEGEMIGYEKTEAYSADFSFTTLNTPALTDVKVEDVTLTSAVVSWKTASLSTAQIEYGETTNYGIKLDESGSASESAHTVRLTNLKHSTEYHFRVRGTTSDGEDIFSQDNIFSTLTFPKVTALIFNTDQSEGGTSAVIAWATNVETSGEVQYQSLDLDKTSQARYTSAELQAMSQTELARVPAVAKGELQTKYNGKYDTRHVERIDGLSDGAIYVFTVRGRDKYGNEVVGEPVRYVTSADTRPPEVKNVIIETPTQGTGSDAKSQIIVSWDTDEPSIGQVLWGQGTGSEYPRSTEKDGALTTKHVFVIRDLQTTTSYHLKILSTDKSGNKTESKDTVVVTPTAQAAAFDIIIKNLEDVFGFLKL